MRNRKRKRKGRLRVGRIIMVLFIIAFIVFLIKLISYVIYNNNVYNSLIDADNNKVVVKEKYNKLRLYKKTINLFKESKRTLVIKDKKYSIEIPSDNIKNGIDLKVKLYDEKLTYDNFPNIKAYFIDNENISKYASKINIDLPKYLKLNEAVDIYGVNGKKIDPIKLNKKTNEQISININKKYDKYFIVYVKLEDMKVFSKVVDKGSIVKLNIKYIPETATIKDYEYTKIGDIFVKNENNEIVAKEKGKGTITIRHKVQNIEKKVNIKVKEDKIKVKDGLTYVDGILIVNKTYKLPENYDPGKLNDEALNAFYEMRDAASKDNITLYISSGYRSYSTQNELYNNYVK